MNFNYAKWVFECKDKQDQTAFQPEWLIYKFQYFNDKDESKNLTIFNIILWVDSTNVSSTKCLTFQVLFFHDFLQNSLQKSFQFMFL
jgi:hypothetical protein